MTWKWRRPRRTRATTTGQNHWRRHSFSRSNLQLCTNNNRTPHQRQQRLRQQRQLQRRQSMFKAQTELWRQNRLIRRQPNSFSLNRNSRLGQNLQRLDRKNVGPVDPPAAQRKIWSSRKVNSNNLFKIPTVISKVINTFY